MVDDVWFWQRIVTPHMARLATELAAMGLEVTYVAEELMSVERAAQGWVIPDLGAVRLVVAGTPMDVDRVVARAPRQSVHICQGLRGNGVVGVAQRALAARGLRQWVVMETVQEHGTLSTLLKRLEYRRQIYLWRDRIVGILATGHSTPKWLTSRGMPKGNIYPFAYFLADEKPVPDNSSRQGSGFRFLFVGSFIERKRVDLLMRALATLDAADFELAVVGSGPLENELRLLADRVLPQRVRWIGRLPQPEVPATIAAADCLVLPSRHDGWGAVISEALIVGTPAICSDRCGVAGVVQQSNQGGVFASGDVEDLASVLGAAIARGPQTQARREALTAWASCLGAAAGARYLLAILRYSEGAGRRPEAPWLSSVLEPSR